MNKEVMRLLVLDKTKHGDKASQSAANVNRAWDEGSTCDWTIRRLFQKFLSGNADLEDQEGRNACSVKQNAAGTG